MKRTIVKLTLTLLLLAAAPSAWASPGLVNGDFSDTTDGLTGWTALGQVISDNDIITWPNPPGLSFITSDHAVFLGDADSASLSQKIFVSDTSQTLTMDVVMKLQGGYTETDAISASVDGTVFYTRSSEKTPAVVVPGVSRLVIEPLSFQDDSGTIWVYERVEFSAFTIGIHDLSFYTTPVEGTTDFALDNVTLTPPLVDDKVKVTYTGQTLVSTGTAPKANVTLNALVQNAAGTGLAGKQVSFHLTAPDPRPGMPPIDVGDVSAPAPTSADGYAPTPTDLPPAVYNVLVTVADSDATDTAILVVYSPTADGFVTGGGWTVPTSDGINTHPNNRCNFGFNAKTKNGVASGNLEFRFSDGYLDLKSTSIEQVMFISPQVAQFTGYASVNKTVGYWFLATVIDAGEPGTNDQWSIQIWAPDPQGFYYDDPVESASGKLQGGNIQIHIKK